MTKKYRLLHIRKIYQKFEKIIIYNTNNICRKYVKKNSMKMHELDEREMELAGLLIADCETTSDIRAKLKRLFAGRLEQWLEVGMDEQLRNEKNSVSVNNSGNNHNGYGKKTINSEFGERA